ncbi:hypothetical protein ACFCWN_00565, partial [Enterococcus faecium]|uniref:hypothetical protein n=1 Tax=Enterococcus faecium TaxID=1352 RepID=UPI0035E0DF27
KSCSLLINLYENKIKRSNQRGGDRSGQLQEKKEFTKIASQIFVKFRLISEEATSGTPFIRKKGL